MCCNKKGRRKGGRKSAGSGGYPIGALGSGRRALEAPQLSGSWRGTAFSPLANPPGFVHLPEKKKHRNVIKIVRT